MPRDTPYAGVASIFRNALERGTSPRIYEDGGQIRDFVHVRDVATANVLAITSHLDISGPFNVASGEPCTLHDMANGLVSALGPNAPSPQITGGYRLGDVRH